MVKESNYCIFKFEKQDKNLIDILDNYISFTYEFDVFECMANGDYNIPVSSREKRILDLSNKKLKVLLEYMFISKIGFELNEVLAFINTEDLKILDEELKGDIKRRLTSANDKISDEEVIEYILKNYPILSNYRNLKGPLTVIEYKNIEDEIGAYFFRFHIMPQSLNFVENLNPEDTKEEKKNYHQIYISEYEHKQKVLRLQKK